MIVLTDGEILLDEMNLTTVINSPKMAGIERYAIGVSWEYAQIVPSFYILVALGERKGRTDPFMVPVNKGRGMYKIIIKLQFELVL